MNGHREINVSIPEDALTLLHHQALNGPASGTLEQAANLKAAVDQAAQTIQMTLEERNKPKSTNMPTTAEVWDEANENLISTHETLCEAIESTNIVPSLIRNIYYLNGSTWLQWIGPRPTNPPGR